jgi:hypothetical protein
VKKKLFLYLGGCSIVPLISFSQAFVVDQQHAYAIPILTWNVDAGAPIGQEFTPALNSLDFVDLYTSDFNFAADGTGGTVSVLIRNDTITGTVLGTSIPDALPYGFSGVTHFAFASPVALQARNRYVIEITRNSGDAWGVGIITPDPLAYSGGRTILLGQPLSDENAGMWFREGITVPEPSTFALFGSMGALLLLRRKGEL